MDYLARADEKLNRPEASKQNVSGFSRFHARIHDPMEKSIAIFITTYHEKSSKSIINDVMGKLARSLDQKNMPFAVLVGDHPVYKLYFELKSDSSQKFSNSSQ